MLDGVSPFFIVDDLLDTIEFYQGIIRAAVMKRATTPGLWLD